MAKKTTYFDYLRQEMGELVDQLDLSDLQKQSLKRRWLDQVIWADKKADQCRRAHYRLRVTTIVGGVILPALVGLNFQLGKDNEFLRTWFPYVPFVLSQVIAVSAASEEFFKYGDRWREYRQLSEDLKAEGWQYMQLSGVYRSKESLADLIPPMPRSETPVIQYQDFPSIDLMPPFETRITHQEGFRRFTGQIEALIKNDVSNYITALQQRQTQEKVQVQQLVSQATAVTDGKNPYAAADESSDGSSYGTSDSPAPSDNQWAGSVNNFTNPSIAPTSIAPTAAPTENLNSSFNGFHESGPGYGSPPSSPPPSLPPLSPPPQSTARFKPMDRSSHGPFSLRAGESFNPSNRSVPIPFTTAMPAPLTPIAPPTPPAIAAPPTTPIPAIAPIVQPIPIAAVNPPAENLNINAKILAAANQYKGASTSKGPGEGNNACGWSLHQVLQIAGVSAIGSAPNYVPAIAEALAGGRGQKVTPATSKAGDIVIAAEESHIGIALTDGCTRVLSNSSRQASFVWETDQDFDGYYDGAASTIYRLLS